MRFAFYIPPPTEGLILEVDLYEATSATQEDAVPCCTAVFERDAKNQPWIYGGLTFHQPIKETDILVLRNLVKVFDQIQDMTPYQFVSVLLSMRGAQLAKDGKRMRCVGTMKEGSDQWEAEGPLKTTITVQGPDEGTAIARAKKAVSEAMASKPDSAADLVFFFSNGCKVKKISSGKLPEYVKISTLAAKGEIPAAAAT